MRKLLSLLALWIITSALWTVSAHAQGSGTSNVRGHGTDLSECENCDYMSGDRIAISGSDQIDLNQLLPERRLDFLLGDWMLIFPDQSIGNETFERFRESEIIRAFQDWNIQGATAGFWAHSSYRYVSEGDRYQFVWEHATAFSIFTGGIEDDGATMAFYEFGLQGDATSLTIDRPQVPVRYIITNISSDQYLTEWQEDRDGDQIYEIVMWRVLMRRGRVD